MSSLIVVTPPSSPALSLALVKTHLRVFDPNDDQLISTYAAAACQLAESQTGRSYVNKGYLQSHDQFPHRHDGHNSGSGFLYAAPRYSHHRGDHRQEIKLLRCPLVQVQKITYIGTDSLPHDLFPAPELWQPSTEYSLGDQVQDSNGNLQEITAVDDSKANKDRTFSSGSAKPAWSGSLSGTAADGPFTWTCVKTPAPAGDFLVDRESEPPRVMPLSGQVWPPTLRGIPNAVKFYFIAGYGNSGISVPPEAKVLQLLLTANFYQNREPLASVQFQTIPGYLDSLVWCLRVMDFVPTP